MHLRILVSTILMTGIAGCVGVPEPAPAPRFVPVPVAVSAPAPAPLSADWRDWPAPRGDWRYRVDGGSSVASFGVAAAPLLSLRCVGGAVLIAVAGNAAAATVRTTSLTRTIALQPGTEGASARLAANDPLLDAMGFSRGRVVIERAGAAPLVVPAWAEILRVVEDCRR